MVCKSRSHTYNRHFRVFIACGCSQVVNTDKATRHSNQTKPKPTQPKPTLKQLKPNQTKPNQDMYIWEGCIITLIYNFQSFSINSSFIWIRYYYPMKVLYISRKDFPWLPLWAKQVQKLKSILLSQVLLNTFLNISFQHYSRQNNGLNGPLV